MKDLLTCTDDYSDYTKFVLKTKAIAHLTDIAANQCCFHASNTCDVIVHNLATIWQKSKGKLH